jgi:lipopolysaccharide transport system ATP-binding protein
MEICGGLVKNIAVSFERVHKTYRLYHHVTGGFKNFLFHFQSSINSLRSIGFEALREVSFEISKGEAIGLVGRNGAGKSTVLALIAGVLQPSQGGVTVNGRISPFLELGAGFHPELSGKENILLNGVLLGLSREAILKKMEEIIAFAELGDFIDQPIRVYSSGMIARLGFSVVAHLDPDILLIDEILAVGDAEFQKKCMDKMTTFKERGVTMIFVSHSPKDISQICSRVIWFDNHTVKMEGDVERVLQEYASTQA